VVGKRVQESGQVAIALDMPTYGSQLRVALNRGDENIPIHVFHLHNARKIGSEVAIAQARAQIIEVAGNADGNREEKLIEPDTPQFIRGVLAEQIIPPADGQADGN